MIESFNDPLAKEVDWNPITRFSIGYLNRKLLKTKDNSILFIPSITSVLAPALFIFMGGYVMWLSSPFQPTLYGFIFHPIDTIFFYFRFLPELLSSKKALGFLFGLVFFVPGLLVLFHSLKPITFNTANRLYSKGFWRKEKAYFNDIHAIQILRVYGSGAGSSVVGSSGVRSKSRTVYELNLVLKNKKRMHMFGHPHRKIIIRDAAELSQMLKVPVWDLTQLFL